MKNKTIKKWVAGCMAAAFLFTGIAANPVITSAAPTKTVTVKTQKQLDAALKDKSVTSIVIKTSKNVSLKIKDGDYSSKTLTVASPKATINNYGDFKKISVNDGKTFTDRGVGNNIIVKDTNSLKLVTGKQSMGAKITVTANNAKLSVVNNGEVDAINVKSTASVSVKGAAKEAPTITANAAGAKIVAAMDANVVLNKPATLTVQSGAELSTLTVNANADVKVAEGASVAKVAVAQNASEVNLVADGKVGSVTVDAKASVNVSGETTATVAITSNVEGASISSSVKTDVTLNAEASVSLDKGAEGSSVKAGNENVTPTVENKTTSAVTVTDSKGQDSSVGAGESGKGEPVKNTETTKPDSGSSTTTGGTGGSGGGSGSGSSSSGSSSSSDSSSSGSGSSSSSSGSSSDNTGGSSSDNNGGSGNTDNTGGSSSSETSNSLVVTVSAICGDTTVYSDVTAKDVVLYSDYTLVAAVGTTEDCTYAWKYEGHILGTGTDLKLDPGLIGKSICLIVSTTVDDQVVTKTIDTPVIASMVQLATNKYRDVVVPYNTSSDDLATFLPGVVDLLDEYGSYVVSTDLDWEEVEYDPTAANQRFKFTAHAAIPAGHRLIGSDEVTCLVTVLGENILSYSTSLLSSSNGTDLVNTAVANNEKVQLESSNYESTLTGNYLQLDSCTNGSSGLGYWVAVNVDFGDVDVSTDTTFGDGNIMEDIAENNQHCKPGATTSSAIVFVDIKTLRDEAVTYYFRKGEKGDLTPITFMLNEPRLEVGELKTSIMIPVGLTIDKDVTAGLPKVLEYYLSGNSGDTISFEVKWYVDAPTLVVGDNDVVAIPTYNYPVDIKWPSATISVDKGACQFSPLSPSLDKLSITSNSMSVELDSNMEYAVTEKSASYDTLSWQKSGLFANLKSNTDYTLYVRIAETDTHYASNSTFIDFTTLFAPKGTLVTSGAIQIKAGEDIKSILPESTDMLGENDEVITEHPVSLTWVSDNEYTGDAGTYVYTAEPAGDYSSVFDFSNVSWPVRTITVTDSDIKEPNPEPVKSCAGDFYIFGNTLIGTTGTGGAIDKEVTNGVITLKPNLSIKPYFEGYVLPVSVCIDDANYTGEDLVWNNEAGVACGPYIQNVQYTGSYLQFYVVLDPDAENNIGAAFYMDYDGNGTKYAQSDLIKIDNSGITFSPADPDAGA